MTITDMIEHLTVLRDQFGNAPVENAAGERVLNVIYDGTDYESYYIVFGK